MKVFSFGNEGMWLKIYRLWIAGVNAGSHGNHNHRYVGVEEEFMSERRVEKPGKDVFLFIGHGDKVHALLLFDLFEIIHDSRETDVGSLEGEARIVVRAILHELVE